MCVINKVGISISRAALIVLVLFNPHISTAAQRPQTSMQNINKNSDLKYEELNKKIADLEKRLIEIEKKSNPSFNNVSTYTEEAKIQSSAPKAVMSYQMEESSSINSTNETTTSADQWRSSNEELHLSNNPIKDSDYPILIAELKEIQLLEDGENKKQALTQIQASMERFVSDNTKSTKIGNAHFWLAEIYYAQNNWDKAALHYLKSYKASSKDHDHSKSAELLFKLASSLKYLGKTKEAKAMLDKIKSDYPKEANKINAKIKALEA